MQRQSVNVFQQKVRISLKVLESLTYNIVECDHLNEILKQTKQLEEAVKEMIPSHYGIVRPCSSTITTAKRVKNKYGRYRVLNSLKGYSSLPATRKLGRPKTAKQRTRVKYVLDVCKTTECYVNIMMICSLSYLCLNMQETSQGSSVQMCVIRPNKSAEFDNQHGLVKGIKQ